VLRSRLAVALLLVLVTAACASDTPGGAGPVGDPPSVAEAESPSPSPSPSPSASPSAVPSVSGAPQPPPPPPPAPARPGWLGTRPLPLRPDGFGEIQPTPQELRDRRLPPPPELLPPPAEGVFGATVDAVPADVAARSTWSSACPVRLEDLRYVTLSFWGFDDRPHTGELLVNATAADGLVEVFHRLYEARFPIEEMRVVEPIELDLPPTGDGNNTSSFVCRAARGSSRWSEHAYGLAIDVNPFHNPYTRGDLVLPELASAYTDRDWQRPGMIAQGDVVTAAFAGIGWEWGGDWDRPVDRMHFSQHDR
jgi:hypothetical protein